MRKNKGFTLTEILAVIVIISVLALVIAPTIINKIKLTGDDANKSQNQIVFEATNLYIEQEKEIYPARPGYAYCIPITDLVEDGKLNSALSDFKTGEKYDNKSVKVSIGSNLNHTYELIDTTTCKNTLPANGEIVIAVSPNNNQWAKAKTARITFPGSGNGYINQYSTDGVTWSTVTGTTKELVFNTTGETSGTAYARVIKDNLPAQEKKRIIKKVDNTAPTCTLYIDGQDPTTNWYTENVEVSFKSKNDEHSGIKSFGLDKKENSNNNFPSVKNETDGADITYYGSVVDKAGNTGTCSINFKQDTLPPTITYGLSKLEKNGSVISSIENNTWSNKNVKRALYPGDAVSDVAKVEYSTDKSTWYTEDNVASYIISSDVINNAWFRATDNAGNVSAPINIIIKVDKTPPWDLQKTYYSDYPAWGKYSHTTITDFGENFGVDHLKYQYCYIGTACGSVASKNCNNTSVENQGWNSLPNTDYWSWEPQNYSARLGFGCWGYSVRIRFYIEDLAGNSSYIGPFQVGV